MDFTAAEALRSVHGFLQEKGIRLVFCEVVEEVRAEFDRSELTDLFGEDAFFPSPATVVSAYGMHE